MRTISAAIVTSIVLLFAPSVHALQVTACGTVVPPGEVGVLGADLTCSGVEYAVYLSSHASLQMNGHKLLGADPTDDGVGCDASCTIEGPGEIGDFEYCVSTNGGTIVVRDLFVHGCENGISATHILATNVDSSNHAEYGFAAQKMRGIGVTANGNGEYGFYGPRLTLIDSTMSGNVEHGASVFTAFKGRNVTFENNGGAGIVGGRIVASELTAIGNQEAGVAGWPSVKLRNSSLGGNHVDVQSELQPRLYATTCETSVQALSPEENWGICELD